MRKKLDIVQRYACTIVVGKYPNIFFQLVVFPRREKYINKVFVPLSRGLLIISTYPSPWISSEIGFVSRSSTEGGLPPKQFLNI